MTDFLPGSTDKPKDRTKNRTMRQELRLYVFSLTVLSGIAFTVLINFYFIEGLSRSIEGVLVLEARHFEQRYLKDPNTPLEGSATIKMFYDDWQGAPAFYHQAIPKDELKSGEFVDVEWFPDGDPKGQGDHFLVVLTYRMQDGKRLHLVADYEDKLFTQQELEEFDQFFVTTLYAAPVFILLMVIVVQLFNRRVNRHTTALADWAERLSLDNLGDPQPDFRYAELNRISVQLQSAFQRIAALLEKEHQFLRNASHELRTPIAVIRANMELLERIGGNERQQVPLERIARANRGMQQLTETLLWLSRSDDHRLNRTRIVPATMIDQCIEDLHYLLADKPVELKRHFYQSGYQEQSLPVTPLRIVLNNLIRNAFQHTQEGEVRILLEGNQLTVSNSDIGEQQADSEESYGLGLTLVQQICERLNWPLTLKRRDGGVCATLTLERL